MVWGKSLDLRPRSVDDVHSVAVAVEAVRFRTQKPLLLLIFIGEFEWGCAKEMDKLKHIRNTVFFYIISEKRTTFNPF